LGSVIRGNIPEHIILSWGLFISALGFAFGLLILSSKEKERE
jgi:hypothetical protein